MSVVAAIGRHILTASERFNLAVLVVASSAIITLLSALVCYGVYFAIGYDVQGRWIAVWLPLIAPAVVAPAPHLLIFAMVRKLASARRERDNAREAAERANDNKTVFFRDMLHDLRSPLTAIIGLAEIMRDERFGPMRNDKYRDYAGDILVSGRHLHDLLDNALDLARIEAGRLELDETTVDMSARIRDAVRIVSLKAEAKGLRLVANIGSVPDLWADERCVMQILVNLLTNSIKFTDAGGTVTLRAAVKEDGGLRIEVADTGIGMRKADLDRVFEPFSQIVGPDGGKAVGSGLGLAIVRSLVGHHGGAVDVASEPGVGTTIGVDFPGHRVVATQSLPQSE